MTSAELVSKVVAEEKAKIAEAREEILRKLASRELQVDEASAELAKQDAKLAELAELEKPQAARKALTLKVGEKGGISIYGLQRMPVTLYVEQWDRLKGEVFDSGEYDAFVKENNSRLTRKGDVKETKRSRKSAK